MRTITSMLLVVLLLAWHAACAAEPAAKPPSATNETAVAPMPPVTKEQVLAAIAMLETNAASNDGLLASYEIVQFAQKSDLVSVRLTPGTIPWANSKGLEGKDAVNRILMGAYVGGEVRAQLQAHNTIDNPYEGWVLVINTYRQMQKKKPEIVVPEVDALAEKQDKGELKSYAAEITNKEPKK